MSKRLWAAALTLPLAAGLAATTIPAATAGDVTPIVIAIEAPLSGAQANNGRDMARGVRLAVNQVNAAGGVNGRPVRLVRLDDQADPALALSMVEQAKAAGAVAVIGPYNSSVGLVNLQAYIDAGIVPVQMTSTDLTTGLGVTVQPKNSQISPPEIDLVLSADPTSVVMLVDPSTYTVGMAQRMRAGLEAKGVSVSAVRITAGKKAYARDVRKALSRNPDVLYISTYYPEGSKIARALGRAPELPCLMGLANVDPAFVTEAGLDNSQLCFFSGVPEATQLPGPRAAEYVDDYIASFNKVPGVWSPFTYDSANILFAAIERAGSTSYSAVMAELLATEGFAGATGEITIDPVTGNRVDLPIYIMSVNDEGTFIPIDGLPQ